MKQHILIALVAIVTSSEVRLVSGHKYISHLALCAEFSFVNNKIAISQSYQCGLNWADINDGIRRQLRDKEREIQEKLEQENEEQRLNRIKNDYVGHIIQ